MTFPQPKIVGLLKTRDEWPLAALAITHFLLRQGDEVYVIDHCSQQPGAEALFPLLNASLGSRIRLYRYEETELWQEGMMNALIQLSQQSQPDWFCPFDSDEFLAPSVPLRQSLAALPASVEGLYYPLENWLAPGEMDDSRFEDYLRIEGRTLPHLPNAAPTPQQMQQIRGGTLSYFALAPERKVLFRNSPDVWLGAGNHQIWPLNLAASQILDGSSLKAIHLPLLSWRRLRRKSRMGQRHQLDGRPVNFGWQNQMLFDLEQAGQLAAYWARHSLGADVPRPGLNYRLDGQFRELIWPAAEYLKSLDWTEKGAVQAVTLAPELCHLGQRAHRAILKVAHPPAPVQWSLQRNLTPAQLAPYEAQTFPSLQNHWRSHPQRGPLTAALARQGQTVVALGVLEALDEKQAELLSLWVAPAYRRQGYGRQLLSRLQAALKPQQTLTAHYKVSELTQVALEPLFNRLGWQAPEPLFLLAKTDRPHIAQAPWLRQFPLSSEFTVFPWLDLTAADRQTLAQLDYPPVLSPLADPERLEPLNSLGLRYREQFIGWLVTHRVDAQTIRYSTLFVAPRFRAKARGIALLSQAILRQMESPAEFYTFAVAADNALMLRFFRRHLRPYMTWVSESQRRRFLPQKS